MSLLIIDRDRCRKDGFCVRECPSAILRLGADGGYPEIVAGGEAACTRCGHCVAVCPTGAFSHADVPVGASPEIRPELRIDAARAEQFLRSRRSVRVFRDTPVERDAIRRLIEVARYAPTGGNSQTVAWTVITDRARLGTVAGLAADVLREVVRDPEVVRASPYLPMVLAAWDAGCDSILRNAPALVVASAPAEAATGAVDLTIALAYLDLMAPSMGLGTCWAGLLEWAMAVSPALPAEVGIPPGHSHHYPMMLGYNGAEYFRMPERKRPRITFV